MYSFLLKPLWRQALHMFNPLLEETQACCFLHVGNTCRACFANKCLWIDCGGMWCKFWCNMRLFASADFDENSSLKSLVILFSCCCCELAPFFLWSIVVWMMFGNEMSSIWLRNLIYPWRPELLSLLAGNKQCSSCPNYHPLAFLQIHVFCKDPRRAALWIMNCILPVLCSFISI